MLINWISNHKNLYLAIFLSTFQGILLEKGMIADVHHIHIYWAHLPDDKGIVNLINFISQSYNNSCIDKQNYNVANKNDQYVNKTKCAAQAILRRRCFVRSWQMTVRPRRRCQALTLASSASLDLWHSYTSDLQLRIYFIMLMRI